MLVNAQLRMKADFNLLFMINCDRKYWLGSRLNNFKMQPKLSWSVVYLFYFGL